MESNPIALIAEIDHELRHRSHAALLLLQNIRPHDEPAQQATYDLLHRYLEQNVALAESIHA
ncbi:hypothetical protein [Herpetosiphon giganteus]|uniref:hypothetical protein n=1 Tax=Herpetosiphon giganteus TaxID=2029754 RepID=UPI00195AE8A8|nr:hypothetical protein [Herpetosiphon giganteus]MBM7844628.1 hypothetical protein [Herpetosiphon giganteus]